MTGFPTTSISQGRERRTWPFSAVPVLDGVWWAPLAIVTLALMALGILPTIVAHRMNMIRRRLDLVIDPARHVAVDLQHTVMADLLMTGARQPADMSSAAVERVATDLASLDSLVPQADPTAVPALRTLRQETAKWIDVGPPLQCTPILAERELTGLRCRTPVTAVVSATVALGTQLDADAAALRARVRDVEQWNVILPILLVPLTLAAVLVVGRSGRRLRHLAIETASARDAFRAAAVERARLLRGVTHDLKNPLGAALGYADLLADGVVGPLTARQAELVDRLAQLIRVNLTALTDLLEWSRLDAPDAAPALAPADLVPAIRDIVTDYRGAAEHAGLTLRLEVRPDRCVIRTDAGAVRRITANLISNALKYTPRGGQVVVRLDVADTPGGATPVGTPRVLVVVEDTGPGIPTTAREAIFAEFVRLRTGDATDGAGVGLAVSRRLARSLGGDITVSERPGGGAIFVLSLPVSAMTTASV